MPLHSGYQVAQCSIAQQATALVLTARKHHQAAPPPACVLLQATQPDNPVTCLFATCLCRCSMAAFCMLHHQVVTPPNQADITPQPPSTIIAAQPQMTMQPQMFMQPQFVASQFVSQPQLVATQPAFVAARPTFALGGTPTFVAAQPTLSYNPAGTFGGYGLGGRFGKGL